MAVSAIFWTTEAALRSARLSSRETERPGYSSAVIENPGIEPRGSLSASIRAINST